jgi:hypothetical protein
MGSLFESIWNETFCGCLECTLARYLLTKFIAGLKHDLSTRHITLSVRNSRTDEIDCVLAVLYKQTIIFSQNLGMVQCHKRNIV